MLKIGANGKPLPTRHNNPAFRLDSPWRKADGTYQSGYYRVWPPQPPGWLAPVYNELDVKPLVKITTNRSKIKLVTKGSPAEGIQLHGDHNQLTVDMEGGPKAWLQTDRSEVRVYGDWNRVSGKIKTEMVALRFNGNHNLAFDLYAEGLEVGDDVGIVVFPGRGYVGNRATDVIAVCARRQYPVKWVHTGFYLDDRASNNVLTACRAVGTQSGVFIHGGTDNRVEVTAYDCEVAYIAGPHFQTPFEIPFNPAPTIKAFGTPFADRRVPKLAQIGINETPTVP